MKANKGFVLVEVLISMMLIGIFIVTICSMNLSIAKIKVMSKKRDEAFNIARGFCEMFKSETGEFLEEDYKTLYRPVERLEEVESIQDIIKNGAGAYNSLDLALEKNTKYVVMINLSKGIGKEITKGSAPNIDILKVKVYINGEDIITMTETR